MRHHVKMATINSWTITSVVKDVKKSEPSYDAFKNVNGADTLENSLAVPQKKINHELTIWLSNSTPREMKICVHISTCTQMFMTAFFMKLQYRNNPKVNQWSNV